MFSKAAAFGLCYFKRQAEGGNAFGAAAAFFRRDGRAPAAFTAQPGRGPPFYEALTRFSHVGGRLFTI